ncbi:hypothetical protein Droror1_Dr00026537 [Drosera rotundifolia]
MATGVELVFSNVESVFGSAFQNPNLQISNVKLDGPTNYVHEELRRQAMQRPGLRILLLVKLSLLCGLQEYSLSTVRRLCIQRIGVGSWLGDPQ